MAKTVDINPTFFVEKMTIFKQSYQQDYAVVVDLVFF